MATQTPNLNLKKPAGTDYVRVGDFNDNANVLDAAIGNLGQLTTDAKASLVLAINEAAQRGGENAPFIDVDTLHWMIWDFGTAQYVDSGVKAEGTDGSDGADGISAFVWIKWSAIQPTQNSDMKDTPDQFIGVYSGTSPTAPTAYTFYQWYKYKGEKGDVGNPGTGNNWYVGTAISGTSLTPAVYPTDIPNALIGDMYLNNGGLPDTGRAYVCTLGGNAATALWKYSCLLRGAEGAGTGDMLKSIYDSDSDGIVDDSEKLGGNLPSYYAPAADVVPKTRRVNNKALTADITLTPADVGADASGTAAAAVAAHNALATAHNIAPHNYLYAGRDLSTIFTAAQLHAAVSAGDFSNIRVGDYWPITLTGTYYDYAESANKTLSSAVVNLEVAGIDTYLQYGDTAVPHHLVMISRDCLPNTMKMRSADATWYNTSATNPWLGSAAYETFNNTTNGILALVAATALGAYIYAGANDKGMRFLGETKAAEATAATGWGWLDRGKLWLPTEREVWGQDVWSEHSWGGGVPIQAPIFAGSLRHIIKGLGNGGSRYYWWCSSSLSGTAAHFCTVRHDGLADLAGAGDASGVPLCFLLA